MEEFKEQQNIKIFGSLEIRDPNNGEVLYKGRGEQPKEENVDKEEVDVK